MGRIGNLVTTWERELGDSDLTSGIFARAVQVGALSPEDFARKNSEEIRTTITSSDCEEFFLERWRRHRSQAAVAGRSIRSVDVSRLLQGLETLFTIHMGSRGLK
jgi:hypothetical protein